MASLNVRAWLALAILAIVMGLLVFVPAGTTALVAIGFYFIFLVYKENTFTAATIQVVAEQTVVSTGPYAIVRHPMYASGLLYLLGTPIALGSYWGLIPFVCLVPFLIWRLFDEERLLCETLPGYREYQQKVRHRLLPGIW
jgi:protein-S-isoprenylcysteine O-methyltransferase Ste14